MPDQPNGATCRTLYMKHMLSHAQDANICVQIDELHQVIRIAPTTLGGKPFIPTSLVMAVLNKVLPRDHSICAFDDG